MRFLLSLEFGCKGTMFLSIARFKNNVRNGLFGNKCSFMSHKIRNFATEKGTGEPYVMFCYLWRDTSYIYNKV